MTNARMRRFTGICALATILLWLAIFPLYTFGPLSSLYDGAALADEFFRIHNIVFTRILLGMGIYVTMLVFAVGLRDLIRRADADYEWVGTLGVAAMAVWVAVTLVANGLEGGAALDALFMATAGYATLATGILPRWTGWLAYAASVLCLVCIPAMYVGPVDPTRFYNAGGWGAAIIANFPPLLWFLVVGILLIWKRQTFASTEGDA